MRTQFKVYTSKFCTVYTFWKKLKLYPIAAAFRLLTMLSGRASLDGNKPTFKSLYWGCVVDGLKSAIGN